MKVLAVILGSVLLLTSCAKNDECACHSEGEVTVTLEKDYTGDLDFEEFCLEEEEKIRAVSKSGYCHLIE